MPGSAAILKKWYVDIGTPVKAGQLLAELETPDLDGQVAQGKADLNTAIANQKLSAVTAKRWDALLAQGAVARQDADAKDSDLAAKNAMVASARANLDHLQAMESLQAAGGAIRWHRHHPRGRCGRAGAGGNARRHAALHRRRPDASCASMCACPRPMPARSSPA